jgi:hypothetical protein
MGSRRWAGHCSECDQTSFRSWRRRICLRYAVVPGTEIRQSPQPETAKSFSLLSLMRLSRSRAFRSFAVKSALSPSIPMHFAPVLPYVGNGLKADVTGKGWNGKTVERSALPSRKCDWLHFRLVYCRASSRPTRDRRRSYARNCRRSPAAVRGSALELALAGVAAHLASVGHRVTRIALGVPRSCRRISVRLAASQA